MCCKRVKNSFKVKICEIHSKLSYGVTGLKWPIQSLKAFFSLMLSFVAL